MILSDRRGCGLSASFVSKSGVDVAPGFAGMAGQLAGERAGPLKPITFT
jgi:hypothetical protein